MAKRRYNLSQFKERKRSEDVIEIETDDGQVFTVDPVSLWSDDVVALTKSGDSVGAARAMLGEDRYTEFVAAGGSAMLLNALLADDQGSTEGESSASQPS